MGFASETLLPDYYFFTFIAIILILKVAPKVEWNDRQSGESTETKYNSSFIISSNIILLM